MKTPPKALSIAEIPKWLEAQLPASSLRLGELVGLNSFTLNPVGVDRVQERLADKFSGLGMIAERFPVAKRGCILQAETKAARDKGNVIVLVGHADTVHPPDSIPHLLEERDGKLFGPGAFDMKAGLVVIELALEALAAANILDKIPVRVVINSAEEEATPETIEFMSQCTNLARAALVFEFGRDGGNIVTSRKGMFIGQLTMKGKSAHAGNNPSAGVSAIEEMGKLLGSVPSTLREASHQTSFNWGVLTGGTAKNVIAENASVDFEVRSATREGLVLSLDRLREVQANYSGPGQLQINTQPQVPPLEESSSSLTLAAEYALAGSKAGLTLKNLPRQGGISDANNVGKSGVPVIDGLGPVGAGAHTKDEYVVASSLYDKALTLIYYLLAQPEAAA